MLNKFAIGFCTVTAVFVLNKIVLLFMSVDFFCWSDHVLFIRVCVYCVCDPNMSLGVPSIYFVCVYICQRLFQRLVL